MLGPYSTADEKAQARAWGVALLVAGGLCMAFAIWMIWRSQEGGIAHPSITPSDVRKDLASDQLVPSMLSCSMGELPSATHRSTLVFTLSQGLQGPRATLLFRRNRIEDSGPVSLRHGDLLVSIDKVRHTAKGRAWHDKVSWNWLVRVHAHADHTSLQLAADTSASGHNKQLAWLGFECIEDPSALSVPF